MAIKINGKDLGKRIINGQEVEKVMLNGGEIRPETIPPLQDDYLCFTSYLYIDVNVGLYKTGNPWPVSIEISRDKENWTDYTIGTQIRLARGGEKVYFRNKSETQTQFSTGENDYYHFGTDMYCEVSGDVNYLLCKHSTNSLSDYCFYSLFDTCRFIRTPPRLPATNLAQWCYGRMFYGCERLESAPQLPATTLADCCYYYMFNGCGRITTAPQLPATTLARYCYGNMFVGCGFTTPPRLPATTLTESCYFRMLAFTAITTPPQLPATTLTSYCYYEMLRGCSSLTTPPELPATNMAVHCYERMFLSCAGLTALPQLPATTLAYECYDEMFSGCTSIKISETQTGEYQTPYRIPSSGTGTDGGYSTLYMLSGTGGTFTGNPNINQTYYTSNQVI